MDRCIITDDVILLLPIHMLSSSVLHTYMKALTQQQIQLYDSKLLTGTTAGPSLKHEAIWNSTVATQGRQPPVAGDNGRTTFSENQEAVAQVEGGGAALQPGSGFDVDAEPVD